MLGGLVGERDLLEPVLYANKRYELSYYRNEVMHIFVEEAVLCCAIYACQKEKGHAMPNTVIQFRVLYEHVRFLSQLFKFEFIFASGRLVENIEKAFNYLAEREILLITPSGITIHPKEIDSRLEKFGTWRPSRSHESARCSNLLVCGRLLLLPALAVCGNILAGLD